MTSPGGPGGREVGRVSIRVVPNSDGFRNQLRRELEAIEKSVKLEVPVGFDIDTGKLRAQLAAIRATVEIPVHFDIDTAALRAALLFLEHHRVDIPVHFDLDTAGLQARLAALDARRINLRVSVDGVALALSELAALEAVVDRLDGRTINIDVDLDTAGALAKLAALEAAIRALRASLGSLNLGGGSGELPIVGGGTGTLLHVISSITKVFSMAPALAVAGAAITAAWGAIATAIAAIPGALALLAGPIAVVAIGMDGIKRAAQTLAPEFAKIERAVDRSLQQSFTRAFNTIRPVMPRIRAGMVSIADSVGVVGQGLAEVVVQADKFGTMQAIFNGVSTSVREMTPGIRNIASALIDVASREPMFKAFTDTVNRFGREFKASVIDLISDGTLDRAFRGLGTVLGELSTAFVQLVDNGIRTFAAAAPGITTFLQDLTGFFERFDWDKLGTAVGNVFAGLGETLRGVDTATIREIEDAFTELGDLFKDKDFQQDLQDMIAGIPSAIRTIRDLADVFGELGSAFSKALQIFDNFNTKFKEFVNEAMNLADDLREKLGLEPVGDWLEGVDDSIDEFLGLVPKVDAAAVDLNTSLNNIFSGSADTIGAQIDEVTARINTGMEPLPELMRGHVVAMVEAVVPPQTLGDVAEQWKTQTGQIGDGIGEALSNILETAGEQMPEVAKTLAPPPGMIGQVTDEWGVVVEGVGSSIGDAMNNILETAHANLPGLEEVLKPPPGVTGAAAEWDAATIPIPEVIGTNLASALSEAITSVPLIEGQLKPQGDPVATPWRSFTDTIPMSIGDALTSALSVAGAQVPSVEDMLQPSEPQFLRGTWDTAVGEIPVAIESGMTEAETIATLRAAALTTALTPADVGLVSSAWQTGLQAVGPALAGAGLGVAGVATATALGIATAAGPPPGVVGTAWDAVPAEIQASLNSAQAAVTSVLSALQQSVQSALTGIGQVLTASTTGWGTAIAAGLQTISDSINTNTAGWGTAIEGAMLSIQAALTAGTTGWSAAVSMAMAAITTAITTGTTGWSTAVTAAMAAISAAITAGTAGWSAAVTAAMAAISAAVTAGTTGWTAAVTAAMAAITTAITTAMAAAVAAVTAGAAQITATFTQLGQQIQQTAQQAMAAFTAAIRSGMADAVAAVNAAVASMVAALNAAVGQFRAAGSNMGAALAAGLRSQLGAVRAAAAELASAAAAATAAAARIASPSKVFLALGAFMGEGLEIGLARSADGIIRAARSLVDAVHDEMDGIQPTVSVQFDEQIGQLEARIRASMSEVNAVVGSAALGDGRQVSITNQFFTESSARESDVVAATLRRQARLGLFAASAGV